MRLRFRGYDNPVVEGFESSYQNGAFTVGEVYEPSKVDMYESDNPHEIDEAYGYPDALFDDDDGDDYWEELVFFDIVEDGE